MRTILGLATIGGLALAYANKRRGRTFRFVNLGLTARELFGRVRCVAEELRIRAEQRARQVSRNVASRI